MPQEKEGGRHTYTEDKEKSQDNGKNETFSQRIQGCCKIKG